MSRLPAFMSTLAVIAALAASGVASATVEVSDWGKLPSGEEVKLYTMTNDNGMVVKISNYGALITSIMVPDKEGKMADVALGFDSLDGYVSDACPYFGAVVGRYGNRIANGQFKIDGKTYNVTKNEKGITSIHGGNVGFNKKMWIIEPKDHEKAMILKCRLQSKDGEEGFPGNLDVTVTYVLPKTDNTLIALYGAKTDKATPVNLTQHCYFNLEGAGEGDVLGHVLSLNADKFTVVNENLIPTGELRDVEGTPFDFRQPTAIGERIEQDYDQLKIGGGYDHNWVLNEAEATETEDGRKQMTPCATVLAPKSRRTMEVYTTEPGVQFYCGNFLDGSLTGKGGKAYGKRSGFCLETQHYPDSPNQKDFPSTILRPGEEYRTATVFRFGVEK